MKIILSLIFLIILSYTDLHGVNYTSTHLSTLNGLSQNDVHSIFQDSKGFVWIGTNDGLNRFDCINFKNYGHSQGLTSGLILSIAEDSNHNLWIGTDDKGLYLYDRKMDVFFHVNSLLKSKIEQLNGNISLLQIVQDKLIVCTKDGLIVLSIQANSTQINTLKYFSNTQLGFNSNFIVGFRSESNGDTWVGTSKGLKRLNLKNIKFETINGFTDFINSIELLPQNKLAIAFHNRLEIIDRKTHIIEYSKQISGKCNLLYTKSGLWMAFADAMYVLEYNSASNKLGDMQLIEKYPNLTNRCLLYDNNNIVWAGFYKEGLRQYKQNTKPFSNTKIQLPSGNNYISTFYEDNKSNLYIGTLGSGIYVQPASFDTKANSQPYNISVLANKSVYAIVKSNIENELFIGMHEEPTLISYNTVTKKITPIELSDFGVRTLLLDSIYLWVGTYLDGLFRYNTLTKKWICINEKSQLSSKIIRNLLLDKKGNIWIATDKGVNVIHSKTKYNTKITSQTIDTQTEKASGYNLDYVIPLFEKSNGDIWIGTLGNGIKVLSQISSNFTCKISSYTNEHGLSNNTIKSIIEDNKGNIWVTSNKGLNRIELATNEIITYDIYDGLQDYEFNELSGLKLKSGALVFGGVNGFNLFYPELILRDSTKAKIVFTDFILSNQRVTPGKEFDGRIVLSQSITETKEIVLAHNQNSFSFEFAALHYVSPTKNSYRYRLSNFEEKWTKTSSNNRNAKYTNIPPGKYQFELQGSNNDGVWNTESLVIELIIRPPFWATWYAYSLYFLTFIIALSLAKKSYDRKNERKKELYIAQLDKKRAKDMLDMKVQFFTNISHEFRTPLTLILSPIQRIKSTELFFENEMLSSAIHTIQHNANTLLKHINQLLNFSKNEDNLLELQLQKQDLIAFTADLFQQFNYMAELGYIQLKNTTTINELYVTFDPYLMEQVMYNLISNAIKHTPSHGTVTLNIWIEDDNWCFTVSDTGNGIELELQDRIFTRFFSVSSSENQVNTGTGIGLSLTKALVELHGGNISFVSNVGKGTTFTVSIPHLVPDAINSVEDFNCFSTDFNSISNNKSSTETVVYQINESNKKLLIVDDNREIIDELTIIFSTTYQIYSAINGAAAFELAIEVIPDIIISDVMMPVMDGIQLCQNIKTDERTSHIPLILLSAKTTTDAIVKGYSNNADAYCPKPFDKDTLLMLTHSILQNREAMAAKFRSKLSIEPSEIVTTASDEKFLLRVIRIVEDNMSNSEFIVDDICSKIGLNQSILNKKLKSLTNLTANMFIRSIRLKRAAQLLKLNRYTVADVTYEVGFNDLRYFRECFKKEFGVFPSQYKTMHSLSNQINN